MPFISFYQYTNIYYLSNNQTYNITVKFKFWTLFNVIIILVSENLYFLLPNLFIENDLLFAKYTFIFSGFLLGSIMFLYRQFITIDKLTFFVTIFICYLLVLNCFVFPKVLRSLCLVGFLLIFLFCSNHKLPKIQIGTIVALLGLSQAVYGLLQYFHIIDLKSHFPILGSYDNPAGFAASLAIALPLYFSLFNSAKPYRFIAVLSVLITTIAVVLSESRAGIISILIVMIVLVYSRLPKKFIKVKKNLVPYIFLIGILLFVTLLVLKKDSAFGRLLIWQVTIEMIKDNLLFGGGSGFFEANYMYYQADFFINNPSNRYVLLADNVLHPFNEYLLVLVEYGTIGFVLLLSIIIIVIKSVKICSSHMLCLLTLGIFSLFSYPLKYPYIWLIVAYSLSQIDRVHKPYFTIDFISGKGIKVSCIVVILIGFIFLIKDVKFEYQWNKAVQESLSGKIRDVLPTYKYLHNTWNGNYFFYIIMELN